MASARRGYVPVDTTTIPTKRRHLSAFNTCVQNGLDKWKSIFRVGPSRANRGAFHLRQPGHKVHFRRHSSFYSNPPTPTTPSPDNNTTYRRSYSSAVPLKPILKSSAAYRHSLQTSRTAPSISTSRRSASHDIRVVPPSLTSRHSISVSRPYLSTSRRSFSASTSRRSFSIRRDSTSPARPSFSLRRSISTSRPISTNSPNSLDLALQDSHSVAVELLTMSATQSAQGVQTHISNFKKHLAHLSHRLTILNEAEGEQAEARQRQLELQQKYMDAVDRQTEAMNELALRIGREVDDLLGMRSESGRDGRDEYPSPAKSDDVGNSSDSDIERFLGRKIAFEPEDQRMGREIDIVDISLRQKSIRIELEVLTAQMALETLDRAKLFKGFHKMARGLKDEIDMAAGEREELLKIVRRHGGRSERKDMDAAMERFKVVREQYVERSDKIGEEYLAMDGKDFFKR